MAGGRSKARLVWSITAAAVVVLFVLAWVPVPVVHALAGVFDGIIWQGKTDKPYVAITFDDGPHPVYTPQVLDTLKQHGAKATFFLTGENARKYPELVARIRAEGHEIGNHTDSLKTTVYMSTERFERSLIAAESTLALNSPEVEDEKKRFSEPQLKLMRPAGGLIRPAQLDVAERHGYTVVLGSAYAWDPARPPAGYIRWVVKKNLEPGAIVVLHDASGDRSRTVAALDEILSAGEAKGLRWVTLSELLQRQP